MAFRQFPAVTADGDSYIIIEFKTEPDSLDDERAQFRYELEDGRHLTREGSRFVTEDGQLRLSLR